MLSLDAEPGLATLAYVGLRRGLRGLGRMVRRFRCWPTPSVPGPMRVCYYCKDVVTRGTSGRVTFTVCARCETDHARTDALRALAA